MIEMLVEPQTRRGARDQAGQRGLAHDKRIAAKIIAVQLDQVEGPHEDVIAMPPIAHSLKARDAVIAAGDSFAIDDAGACAEAGERIDDQREAVGEIIARPAIEAHTLANFAGDDPEAVVLDLVQPRRAGRRLWCRHRQTRRDEAGGQDTRRHGPGNASVICATQARRSERQPAAARDPLGA
jgi:hypothetical protein